MVRKKFVLKWKIDEDSLETAEKAESKVFKKKGFKWTATVQMDLHASARDLATFSVRCEVDHSNYWDCDCDVRVMLPQWGEFGKKKVRFNEECGIACVDQDDDRVEWNDFIYKICYGTVEIHIDISRSERGRPVGDLGIFGAPNNRSDVILKIGDKKLHVSKEVLAIFSPVFNAMFFGDFAEKGKEEVELKDVIDEEFVFLLHAIYYLENISHRNVSCVLKLSDRFMIDHLTKDAVQYLIETNELEIAEKLFLAEQYRLTALKKNCFANLKCVDGSEHCIRPHLKCLKDSERQKLKSSPEFGNFSADTKAVIQSIKCKTYSYDWEDDDEEDEEDEEESSDEN